MDAAEKAAADLRAAAGLVHAAIVGLVGSGQPNLESHGVQLARTRDELRQRAKLIDDYRAGRRPMGSF